MPGGTLTLVQYFGLNEPRSADDQQALLSAMAKIAPEIARELAAATGIARRLLRACESAARTVSEAWAWLGGYEVARDVRGRPVRRRTDRRGAEADASTRPPSWDALLGTMLLWSRLSPEQRGGH